MTFFPQSWRKVKCTLVQALRLCTGRAAHRGSRGTALLFHDHGTRRGWEVSVIRRPLYPEKDPVPIVQEAGWAPGPVWTGAENLAPTGIRFPDRPALSQSLYRLRYPAHSLEKAVALNTWLISLVGLVVPKVPQNCTFAQHRWKYFPLSWAVWHDCGKTSVTALFKMLRRSVFLPISVIIACEASQRDNPSRYWLSRMEKC